jgi:hypothetical protein
MLLLSNFIIAELKWNFITTKSLINYFNVQSNMTTVISNFSQYLQRVSEATYYSLFSFNNFLALTLLVFFIIFVAFKERNKKALYFLLAWLFSTFPLFSFSSGVLNGMVINSSIFAPITLIFALGLYYLMKERGWKIVAITIILVSIVGNLRLLNKENFKSIQIFALQPLVYKDQKALINYAYNEAKGKPFSICAVTNPLFINTLWSHLFFHYGKSTFGYLPTWSGQKQYLNLSLLPYASKNTPIKFLIIEPEGGIPEFAPKATIYLEDMQTKILDTKHFGEVIIQKRAVLKDSEKITDSQNLDPQELMAIKNAVKIDPRYSCSVTH